MRYLQNDFLYDFVPILPLQELKLGGDERLFFIIKIIRLYTGIKLFDVAVIMEKLKFFNKKQIDKIIQTDKMLAENITIDNNNITKMLIINFVIKVFKLVLIIMNISYFIGFFWYLLSDLSSRWYSQEDNNYDIDIGFLGPLSNEESHLTLNSDVDFS